MDTSSRFERRLAQNEVVYRQGERSDEMYYVRKGRIKIIVNGWGKETLLTVVEEGGFFGETALIGDTPRINTAVALEEAELIVIDRQSFDANLAANPVLKYILETLIERIKEITALVYEKDEVKI
jgi:CRP/FNR family cyclic AMP-dependent transcriptional regulator